MKFNSEIKWLVLAILSFVLFFERHETLEVKDGMVSVYKTTCWFRKRLVKSMKASCVGAVKTSWQAAHHSSTVSLDVYDSEMKVFYKLYYQGVDKPNRAFHDASDFRRAIRVGTGFSEFTWTALAWIVLMVISLLVYWYKRSWRIERARQAREEAQQGSSAKHAPRPLLQKRRCLKLPKKPIAAANGVRKAGLARGMVASPLNSRFKR